MTDNTQLNTGTGGDFIRDIDRGGQGTKTQVIQLDAGGDANNRESLVSLSNPLPVADVTMSEGLSIGEALNLLLIEQRITNEYLYGIMKGFTHLDEPDAFRAYLTTNFNQSIK